MSSYLCQFSRNDWFVRRGCIPVDGLDSSWDLLAHAHSPGPATGRLARHHGRLVRPPHLAQPTAAATAAASSAAASAADHTTVSHCAAADAALVPTMKQKKLAAWKK